MISNRCIHIKINPMELHSFTCSYLVFYDTDGVLRSVCVRTLSYFQFTAWDGYISNLRRISRHFQLRSNGPLGPLGQNEGNPDNP